MPVCYVTYQSQVATVSLSFCRIFFILVQDHQNLVSGLSLLSSCKSLFLVPGGLGLAVILETVILTVVISWHTLMHVCLCRIIYQYFIFLRCMKIHCASF